MSKDKPRTFKVIKGQVKIPVDCLLPNQAFRVLVRPNDENGFDISAPKMSDITTDDVNTRSVVDVEAPEGATTAQVLFDGEKISVSFV